jgi:hypothetical protein
MASLAVCPKGQDVILCKHWIYIEVTGGADQLIKWRTISFFMTILALKRRTIHSQAMRFQ